MDERRIKSLKARVGRECCISRVGPDGPSNTVEVISWRCGITRRNRDTAGRGAVGVRAT